MAKKKKRYSFSAADFPVRPSYTLGKTAVVFAAIVGSVAVGFSVDTPATVVALAVVVGFLLQYPYNAMHDCIHGTFLRRARWNEFFGVLFGTVILTNYNVFKAYHLAHHRHTFAAGDPEPTTQYITSLRRYAWELFVPLFFFDNWRDSVRVLRGRSLSYASVSPTHKRKMNRDTTLLILWCAAALGLSVGAPQAMLTWYWAPLYLSYVLDFFFLLPEHYDVEQIPGRNWRNARTTLSIAPVRAILCNINYHVEHHMYPAIPHQYLPAVHAAVAQRIKYRQRSYLAFHARLLRSFFGARPGRISA